MKTYTVEELKTDLETEIYKASVRLFEIGEHSGVLRGNGHHMAQELVEMARQLLLSRLVQGVTNETTVG